MSSSLLPFTSTLTAFPSTNTQSISQRAFKTRTNQTQGFRVSCNSAPDDHNDRKLILPEAQKLVLPNVDRRNLLVGLGGLYTATNLTSLPTALAAPVTTPDITSICKDAKDGTTKIDAAIRTRKCCPPSLGKAIKDYVIPSERIVRKRWPAHQGTKKQVDDYINAIAAMRALPDDDPHSFASQAKIHCAYCNGAYNQEGVLDKDGNPVPLQIHNSWLFFPFHRWYVYFYERILGKLIGVDDFALPFWKWDEPAGMPIPEIFLPKEFKGRPNPLFDVYRDAGSLEDRIVDLAFQGKDKDRSVDRQILCNLNTVYRDLVRNGADTLGFFGGKYVAGKTDDDSKPAAGSVESGSHTAVHRWVGDDKQPNDEDMGNFYSAGYDPLFYVHHANVDRTWKLWKDLALPGHVEPTDPDWLNASYVFYDENKNLVRVYNKDCVDINKLSYRFIENSKEVFPWRKSRPAQRSPSVQVESTEKVPTVDELKFPVSLEKILKVRVKRPAVNRTKEEKKKESEVLLINEIKFDCNNFVKFDVFVNDKVSKGGSIPTVCDPEYAGSFARIPHSDVKKASMKSGARFGLNQLLDDTNTEGEEYATVALVPKTGFEDLTIGEIKIKLVPRL
uniref:Aurone synthase n=1 Tax=Coreopsis grandiflora TaxID=13449 RepID=A0A075BX21_CORGR|nr:aurone synthase [Coreopsis grandiflora]